MANDKIQIPPDSTGKKVATKTFTIDGESVHLQSVLLAGGNDPENSQFVDAKGSAYIRFSEGEPVLDPYANIKMSRSYIVGTYDHSSDSQDDLYTVVEENGGTSIYDDVNHRVTLRCDTTNGAICQRTTNRYHFGMYGVGILCLFSIRCGDEGKTNNTRRWGYYDDNNGCFFELNGTTLNAVVRANGVDDPIEQSLWNKDELDGTGASGYTLDLTEKETYWINIRWPGNIIFGAYSDDGVRIVCHVFSSDGEQPRTASLPLRLENINTGATISTTEVHETAMSVSYDNIAEYTFWRYSDIATSSAKTVLVDTPLVSLRSALTFNGNENRTTIFPDTLSVYTDQPVKISLIWDGEISGASWSLGGSSTAEGDEDATSIAYGGSNQGYQFVTEYCGIGVTNISLSKYFELNDEGVCLTAEGTESYVLSFVATRLTNSTTTTHCTLTYRELR